MEMSHWENWIIEEQYIFYVVFNITYFFTTCVHCYILCLKKTEETNNFQYKYIFYDQDHICWISNSTTILPQENLNFWLWNKTAYIWQWKDKEDCSSSEVPYGILIIWMTVATKQNEAQLSHLSVIIFWHNPTAPWYACLILARFLQLSWQKLGSWIILAIELVTLQVLCH